MTTLTAAKPWFRLDRHDVRSTVPAAIRAMMQNGILDRVFEQETEPVGYARAREPPDRRMVEAVDREAARPPIQRGGDETAPPRTLSRNRLVSAIKPIPERPRKARRLIASVDIRQSNQCAKADNLNTRGSQPCSIGTNETNVPAAPAFWAWSTCAEICSEVTSQPCRTAIRRSVETPLVR